MLLLVLATLLATDLPPMVVDVSKLLRILLLMPVGVAGGGNICVGVGVGVSVGVGVGVSVGGGIGISVGVGPLGPIVAV
ncbi:MAG: hypothetical protein A2Y90_00385 [Chloroflexi bacterium RBG_13_52_12]|nr:MAG: hypothetical protein A2Y90_00385 [Chloroflexi bacterium RBG_13_52_12]